jgi:hypothetical protein
VEVPEKYGNDFTELHEITDTILNASKGFDLDVDIFSTK